MWPGAGKQKGNSGGPPVPGWVEVLEPCYFFFRNTPVKKSFSSSFHPSRTGCAWMCHLSVPWHTRDNPPKIIQNWCLIVFAKYGKKIGKSGRPKMLNLLLCHMWKRWFWGATFHFFGINVPGCAILVFRGSLPKKCLATQKRLTPCWFLCETVGFEVLLLIFHIFRSGKEGKNPTIQKVVWAAVFIFLGQDAPGCAILVFW